MRKLPHLSAKLKELGFATYEDYLASDHWKALRVRYAKSKMPKTCACGERTVELHHRTYIRLGAERVGDLWPLCRQHHDEVHRRFKNREGGNLAHTTRMVSRMATGKSPYKHPWEVHRERRVARSNAKLAQRQKRSRGSRVN